MSVLQLFSMTSMKSEAEDYCSSQLLSIKNIDVFCMPLDIKPQQTTKIKKGTDTRTQK